MKKYIRNVILLKKRNFIPTNERIYKMGKNILIISGSPRKGGNSETLCDKFASGAAESGHNVEKIWLGSKKIGFCLGCLNCETGACPQKDDAAVIGQKMLDAEIIVLATPVYFYSMCAQLKALIDRSVMYYPKMENKKFYFLMTMADTDEENFKGTVASLNGFVECCPGSEVEGMICASGVYGKGEIDTTPYPEAAYKMGKEIR